VSVQFFPLEGCRESADEMRTVLASSVLHLFTDALNPDPSTPLADYTAAEADYTGYAAETLTAWHPPILAPGTGYMIGSPLVQFEVGATPTTTNVIAGCYLVDAAGDLRMTVIFTSPVPMQLDGQGIPLNLVWLFPTGL
jgi:hypothetical protein